MAGTEEGVEMNQLVKYEAAKFALAEAVRVDEVMDIRDKSAAIAAAARVAKDRQLEIDASEIRIRAERRLGEMLREQKQGDGLAKPGPKNNSVDGDDRTPTLAEIGISKDLSSRAQAIAAIPAEDFEVTLDEHRAQQQAVTATTMQKLAEKAKQHEQKEVDTKPEKPGVGIRLANEAIACLARIPLRDNCREEAWKMVKNWLKNNQ